EILRRVVEPAIPALPVALDSPDAAICRDLLSWSLKVIGNEPLPSVLGTLRKLPVPCFGGWYPMAEATFGPGWDGKHGDQLKALADGLPEEAGKSLLSRVLLAPDYDSLAQAMFQLKDLLSSGGIV